MPSKFPSEGRELLSKREKNFRQLLLSSKAGLLVKTGREKISSRLRYTSHCKEDKSLFVLQSTAGSYPTLHSLPAASFLLTLSQSYRPLAKVMLVFQTFCTVFSRLASLQSLLENRLRSFCKSFAYTDRCHSSIQTASAAVQFDHIHLNA